MRERSARALLAAPVFARAGVVAPSEAAARLTNLRRSCEIGHRSFGGLSFQRRSAAYKPQPASSASPRMSAIQPLRFTKGDRGDGYLAPKTPVGRGVAQMKSSGKSSVPAKPLLIKSSIRPAQHVFVDKEVRSLQDRLRQM